MPNHMVIREAVTTKIRIVFNALAKEIGRSSLNDLVDPGPSLLPDLTGLLPCFRECQHAIQADIRKAFFMVEVRQEDRPYLGFVWLQEDGEVEIWQLKKLPFGVNCAPFLLSAVLQYHLSQHEKSNESTPSVQEVISLLRRSFYVDDCISSLNTAAEAQNFKAISTEVLKGAGMDLRKW